MTVDAVDNVCESTLPFVSTVTDFGVSYDSAALRGEGDACGAAAPGPAVLGARNWCEWNIFMCCI